MLHDAGSSPDERKEASVTLLQAIRVHNSVDESVLLVSQGTVGPAGPKRPNVAAPVFGKVAKVKDAEEAL